MNFPLTVDSLSDLSLDGRPVHLAIGKFDGVHRGHRAVVEAAVRAAREAHGNALAAVLTFWPHPSRVLNPDHPVAQIMPPGMKSAMLHDLGVDLVVQIPFTRDFAAIEARDFLPYLKSKISTLASISIGDDFCFGRGRTGDMKLLIEEARKHRVAVTSSGRITELDEEISSNRIREFLQGGCVERANRLLGYRYFCVGTPVRGRGAGRGFGFPTLNFPWAPELRPAYGVYAVDLALAKEKGEARYPGVANYGVRPTVEANGQPILEVHLFSFPGIPEVAVCRVEWVQFIRAERKFPNVDALMEQIALDKHEALGILESIKLSGHGVASK